MKKILVYSHSAGFAAMMRGMLSNTDAIVQTANRIGELSGYCRRETFDCIISDDVRLFTDGAEIIRVIRNSESAAPKIFVLSADITEDTVLAVLGAGVDQYISLPVNSARLLSKLSLAKW